MLAVLGGIVVKRKKKDLSGDKNRETDLEDIGSSLFRSNHPLREGLHSGQPKTPIIHPR
jgi:hypothetical protein